MKRGLRLNIHGAFKHKSDAKRKERSVKGFIIERSIRGHKRFVVLTQKKK